MLTRVHGLNTAIRRLRFGVAGWMLAHAFVFAAAAAEEKEAVSTDYVIREWNSSDGLPSDQIARVYQDGEGFLWVVTNTGVVRFDGSHFEKAIFNAEPGAKIRLMAWSPKIGLLGAVSTGGLVILEHGRFVPWRPADYQGCRVAAMFVQPDGVLWLGCEDGSVIRHDGENLRVFRAEDGMPSARVRTFATDPKGAVWISGDDSVVRYAEGKLVSEPENFRGSKVRLVSGVTGGPWAITQTRVKRLVENHWTEVATLPPRFGSHYVQSALEDRNGLLWIGTRSQGLYIVANGLRQRVPTSSDDIYALLEDREGNVWAGTNGGGLGRIRRKSYRLFDKAAGLLDNFSYTVCTDVRGDVWFANRDGGLARWRDGVTEHFTGRPGWPVISAMSVFPRSGGGVGVTTGIGLFLVSDAATPTISRVRAIPQKNGRVSYVAKNGDVWLAFDAGQVGRLRDEIYEPFGPEQGLDHMEVRAIAEDKTGAIWLGATEGKLFRFAGGRFERIPLPGIEPGAIHTIRIEPDGRVWLGTLAAGVVTWFDGKLSTCNTHNGLPSDDITQILPDDHGFIWFASKHHIFRLGRREVLDVLEGKTTRVAPRTIGPDDGIKELTCSGLFQPGAWKSPDGSLWFATRRGVLAIDPTRQFAAPPVPPVAIEEVAFDGQSVPIAQHLRIDSRVHRLEFRFGVLCLSHPESIHAEYRLEGFDQDWIVAPANRRVAYPRLPPGTYRFNARASVGEGGDPVVSDTLELTVVPRWWQTDWFYMGAALVSVLGITVAARLWAHRRLRRQVGKLEREMAIRTRIAQNIHDDLGANLTQISLLTQTGRQKNSDSASSFEQIHTAVGEITRSMDEIVWAVNPKFDDVESLAGYLGDFARNFLSAAGLRCRLELPADLPARTLTSQARHHLFLCCKEALNNIVKHAGATEVTIAIAIQRAGLTIAISDNGRGWEAPAKPDTPAADRVSTGNGLENMRQRMAEIGGRFTIQTRPAGGTTVTFLVEWPPISPR